jgi:hypothetical protein
MEVGQVAPSNKMSPEKQLPDAVRGRVKAVDRQRVATGRDAALRHALEGRLRGLHCPEG